MLTQKQVQLLEFIQKRMARDGVPPSFDEMKDALDLRSKSGIHRLVTALEERGFIRRLPHRARALEIGAHEVFDSGERLPAKVDAVMETVGAATWSHSIRSMRPGGTLVISGATSGDAPTHAELTRIFFQQMRVHGSTMGTRDELRRLAEFMAVTDTKPLIDAQIPMENATEGLQRVLDGDVFGKIVLTR